MPHRFAFDGVTSRARPKAEPADEPSSAGLRSDSGLAAVEFALIAPILLMLVFGIIIYGIYFGTWIGLSQAAAEGARASVAGLSEPERRDFAKAAAQGVLDTYGALLENCEEPIADPVGESHFAVTVSCDLSGLGAGLADLIPLPTTTPSATSTVANGSY